MNTENFSIQGSLDGNYLNIALEEQVSFDEIALKVMEQDTPEFFLPFKVVDINDSISLKYRLVNNIALKYADTQMSKKTFLKLFLGLVKPFIECKDWMLNYRNICIDPEYIYLDKSSGIAKFVYIPEYSYTNEDAEIFNFLKTTFTSKSITDDPAFQVKMFQFFMRDDVTLIELYNILKEEKSSGSNAMPVVNTTPQPVQPAQAQVNQPVIQPVPYESKSVKTAPEPQPEKKSGSLFAKKTENNTPDSKKQDQKQKKKDDMDDLFGDILGGDSLNSSGDDLFGDIFDSKSKKTNVKENKPAKPEKNEKKSSGFGALFGSKKNKTASESVQEKTHVSATPVVVQKQQNIPASPILNQAPSFAQPMFQEADMEKTEIIYDSFGNDAVRPHLAFVSSPIEGALKVIYLDVKPDHFIIGRVSNDENQADVCFSNAFKRIGRKHARIECEAGKYYIIDLGSQNKTLFNGIEMIPNKKYELVSGAEVTFTSSLPVKYRVVL